MPPLVPWCLCFCLGIVAQDYLPIPLVVLWILLSLFLSSALIFLKREHLSQILLFCTAFLFGATLLINSKTLSDDSIAHLTPARKQSVTLRGIVLSDPEISGDKTTFILGVREFMREDIKRKVRGKVLVRWNRRGNIFYGDELMIEGGLYRPFNFSSNRKQGYADFLKSKGIYSILSVRGEDSIKKIGQKRGPPMDYFVHFLKQGMEKIISSNLAPPASSILHAMLLGEAGRVPPSVRDAMIKTGTWHVMVVSGSNTALVAYILLFLFKILKVPRRLRYGLTVGFLLMYCSLTGASSPVMRATVMSIVLLVGYMVERNSLIYNSLSLAALVILILDPQALFNAGFQLSFASVFFIVWLFPKIKKIFSHHLSRYSFADGVLDCFYVSVSAWLGTAPLIAYAFGNFSPITVLANVAVVPLAMLVVSAGFAFLVIATIFPPSAVFLGPANEFLILIFLKINFIFSKIPFAYYVLAPLPLIAVFGYYILIFCIFNFCLQSQR